MAIKVNGGNRQPGRQAQRTSLIKQGLASGAPGIQGAAYKAALEGTEAPDTTDTAVQRERVKRQAGKRAGITSADIVFKSLRGLGDLFAEGHDEGGMGDIYKSMYSTGVLKGLIPKQFGGRKAQSKLEATAAYPGKKTEVITKFMPMLTQQGDKPGSVRLVSTVFDKLWGSFPEKHHELIPGRRMLTESGRNIYAFASALDTAGSLNAWVQQQGLDPATLENMQPEQLEAIANKMSMDLMSISTDLTPEQQQHLGKLEGDMTVGINEQIVKGSKKIPWEFESEEEVEDIDLPVGTHIIIGGRKAIIEEE